MNKQYEERKNRLLPNGKPRYIRCYDAPEWGDRYTVVFTGHYTHKTGRQHWVMGMTEFGSYYIEEYDYQIDYPAYGHLGKKIKFDDMDKACQNAILKKYVYLWDITDHPYFDPDGK